MANENTRFYITADLPQADNNNVTIATGNTPGNSSVLEVSIKKTTYEGTDGRSRLIKDLEQIIAKIMKSAWPAI